LCRSKFGEQRFSGLGDLLSKFFLAGQRQLVLAGENFVLQVSESVVRRGFIFLAAENQSERRVASGQS
jgi:hypothetical protein